MSSRKNKLPHDEYRVIQAMFNKNEPIVLKDIGYNLLFSESTRALCFAQIIFDLLHKRLIQRINPLCGFDIAYALTDKAKEFIKTARSSSDRTT